MLQGIKSNEAGRLFSIASAGITWDDRVWVYRERLIHGPIYETPGGDEPDFSRIRNFILNGSRIEEIGQFVTYSREQAVHQLRAGNRLSVWGHVLLAEADYNSFRAKVQLFVGPQNGSVVYTVQLGRNGSPIHYSEAYGDFFAYYPIEERGEFDGEVSELGVVTRL